MVWVVVSSLSVQLLSAQDEIAGKKPSLDSSLKAAFDALSKKNYREARVSLEAALGAFDKDPSPSEWLFERIRLPDEDAGDVTSKDPNVRAITGWRHSMGSRQALLTFMAFTAQLEGNKVLADKYLDEVYRMQGPLWGVSWRMFIPPIQAVFHTALPKDESENFGRYLHLAGILLEEADEEMFLPLFERAQKLAPRDAEIAGNLASAYVVRLRALEAKSLAQLSLSLKPKQPRVLIDLATAEWLLGDLESAKATMTEATGLRPDLPGPQGTLALVFFTQGNLVAATKAAERGVALSKRHPYYLAIQAIVLEGSGKSTEADKNIVEAWKGEYPSEDQLRKWFFRDKPLETILKVLRRQKTAPK